MPIPAPIEFMIFGTQDPDITRQQLATAKLAEIRFRELYCIIYGDAENGDRLDTAQAIAGEGEANGGIWLDCESTETGLDATNSPEIIGAATSHLDVWGGPWGVYSNAGFWDACMAGESHRLIHPRASWVASWLPHREPTAEDFRGWGTEWPAWGDGYIMPPATWQYDHDIQLETPYGPVHCDLDSRFDFNTGRITYGIDVSNYSGELNVDALRWLRERPDLHAEAPGGDGAAGEPPPGTLVPAPLWLAGGIMPDGLPHGLILNGKRLEIYNGPQKPVLTIGDVEGKFPGRFGKLFGDDYAWLRRNGPDAFWDAQEGD